MKNLLLCGLVVFSVIFSNIANAQVHSKGADGPAAVADVVRDTFAAVVASYVDPSKLSCDEDATVVVKQILATPKIKSLGLLAQKTDAKAFIKRLGLSGTPKKIFGDAALDAVELLCNPDENDPGSDDPEDSGRGK